MDIFSTDDRGNESRRTQTVLGVLICAGELNSSIRVSSVGLSEKPGNNPRWPAEITQCVIDAELTLASEVLFEEHDLHMNGCKGGPGCLVS